MSSQKRKTSDLPRSRFKTLLVSRDISSICPLLKYIRVFQISSIILSALSLVTISLIFLVPVIDAQISPTGTYWVTSSTGVHHQLSHHQGDFLQVAASSLGHSNANGRSTRTSRPTTNINNARQAAKRKQNQKQLRPIRQASSLAINKRQRVDFWKQPDQQLLQQVSKTNAKSQYQHDRQDYNSTTSTNNNNRSPFVVTTTSAAADIGLLLTQPLLRQQQQSLPIRQQRQIRTTSTSAKCALILQRTYVRKITTASNGIEDTSADYMDQLTSSGAIEPTGRMERVCIKFEDVDKAIELAKQRRGFQLTEELKEAIQSIEPMPPFIAQLGELNQEVTKLLAERFDLSNDEILNGLPLIDMSRTSFWQICPLMVKPIQCDPTGRFRSFTGHCNNLKNPAWGAAQTPFVRYLAPRHPDGIEKDRVSVVDSRPLPLARQVTSMVHRDADSPSSDLSLLIMVWGQIIDHDVALAAPPRGKFG